MNRFCKPVSRLSAARLGLAVVLAWSTSMLHAQQVAPAGYPAKPIRVVVTSAAGGGLEIITRQVMERVGQRLGKPVIIDVQAGGTGVIGTQIVASAAADGYTVLGTGDSLLINNVMKKLPFDIRQTLTPVARTTVSYYMWFVHSSVPASSIRELVAYARANPGRINFATSGTGGVAHLGTELLKSMGGLDMIHVPYKGNGPATIDLAAGRVQMMFGGLSAMHLVKSGQLKLIGTLSPKRLEQYPDVPTAAESGFPGYELSNTYAVYAPIKTPLAILAFLNREISQVVRSPELAAKLAADYVDPAPAASPEELRKIVHAEVEKWEGVVKAGNIRSD